MIESASGERPRAPVAITGLGAVSALGRGAQALFQGLLSGEDGIRPIERFPTEGFSVRRAAMVPGVQADESKGTGDIALELAIEAATEAIRHAKIDIANSGVANSGVANSGVANSGVANSAAANSGVANHGVAASRVAIVFGTSLATHAEGVHRLAELTAEALSFGGPRLTISTACSSSANAVGLARDLLLEGVCDVAIAGGSDALTGEIFAGFHNLGLLAPESCAPFSEPPGTTLGEGAGFLVLERAEDANRRGADVVAWVSGMGLSCDAHHATSPDPSGAGIARAARAALSDAGLTPSDIDYVNAHGTGTEANDPAEFRGLVAALGERAAAIPVSATKSILGHGQGAAGVLEIIATVLAMERGLIPQTLHHTLPRPRCPPDPVAQKTPRPHPVAHALCDSSAFGGANALITIDEKRRPARPRRTPRREVYLIGGALVLPGIGDIATFASLPVSTCLSGRAPPGPPLKSLASVDLRGFDPQSRLLTSAVGEALRDGAISVRGALRDRAGLFGALTRISAASAHELDDSVKERGLLRLSAPAFTRVVLNAATGAAARSLQLRGPTTTLTTGDGSGLVALALACDHLSLRDDADMLCAASADEIDVDDLPAIEAGERDPSKTHGRPLCEAAACAVLATGPLTPHNHRVRVAGWGLSGPGDLRGATALAAARAGVDPSMLSPALEGIARVPAPATAALLTALVAYQRLRDADDNASHPVAQKAILLTHDSRSAAVAVLLERVFS